MKCKEHWTCKCGIKHGLTRSEFIVGEIFKYNHMLEITKSQKEKDDYIKMIEQLIEIL